MGARQLWPWIPELRTSRPLSAYGLVNNAPAHFGEPINTIRRETRTIRPALKI